MANDTKAGWPVGPPQNGKRYENGKRDQEAERQEGKRFRVRQAEFGGDETARPEKINNADAAAIVAGGNLEGFASDIYTEDR